MSRRDYPDEDGRFPRVYGKVRYARCPGCGHTTQKPCFVCAARSRRHTARGTYEKIVGVSMGLAALVEVDGVELRPREDLVQTWATRFEWGRVCFGAQMLSVAILARAFDDAFAREHYQAFTREILGQLPDRRFSLSRDRVVLWRRSLEPDDFDRALLQAEARA